MKFGNRINLHTHTLRCKHATGQPEDYCREALEQGISILGFSDHAPFLDGRLGGSRMFFHELPDYAADVDAARQFDPALTVLKGLEVDYYESVGRAFYEDAYLGVCGCDYMVAGTHSLEPYSEKLDLWRDDNAFGADEVLVYLKAHLVAMETGLFDFFAHPDAFARCTPYWTDEIKAVCADFVDASIALDIPLEINAYGIRKPALDMPEGKRAQYPWRPFWELVAEKGGKVVVSSDAHRPEDVWGNTDDTLELARELGLQVVNRELADKIIARRNDKAG